MQTHPSKGVNNDINLVSSALLETSAPALLSSDSSLEERKVRPATAILASASTSATTSSTTSTTTSSITQTGDVVPDFDQPRVVSSPAPVPMKGGDDEVIRVSHVRKIIINTGNTNTNESLPLPPKENKAMSHCEQSKSNNMEKSTGGSHHRLQEDEDSSDDDFQSDSEPMDVIEKSPYEANLDAEKGVALFTRMKNILNERTGGNDNRTGNNSNNAEATKVFGASNAWYLVKASALIERSGMVYSQEWCTGHIRGNQLGPIPKELLILCLVSSRFAKAQDLLLAGLTRDFEITVSVQEATEAWNLSASYPKIMGVSTKNMQFQSSRRDCYKCAIFVGRAYSCYKAFGKKELIDASLMAKIKRCLDLMESHLADPPVSSKTKKKSVDFAAAAAAAPMPKKGPSDSVDTGKRKRGRPRKNPLSGDAQSPKNGHVARTIAPAVASARASLKDDDDDEMVPYNIPQKKGRKSSPASKKAIVDLSDDEMDDDDEDFVPYNPPVRGTTSGMGKKSSTKNGSKAKSTPTPPTTVTKCLSNLVLKFEAQYEGMGKAYKKMGSTLRELKTKIQENRAATEEQIRSELLQEVHDNLLKSFGQK